MAVLAVAAIFVNRVEQSLTQNIDREDLMPTDSSTAPTKEPVAADALNFVVMGYDSRNPSVTRSGSLMILHLNAKRDQAYFISFPRDTWVSIPGRGNNKINAAYGFGGPKLTVSTLQNLTDTRIDHTVLVDFQGFARLTDAVGGVTVYNKTAFSSSSMASTTRRATSRSQVSGQSTSLENGKHCPAAISTGPPTSATWSGPSSRKPCPARSSLTQGDLSRSSVERPSTSPSIRA